MKTRAVKLVCLVAFLFLLTLAAAQNSGSAEENKAFIREFIESISGQEKTPELVTSRATSEALIQHIAAIEAAFPRYELIIEDMIAEGNKVAARLRGRATHEGEFAGIAPTGRQVEFDAIAIYQFEDGMITDFWIQADMMSLMQQLTAEE